VVIIFKLQNIPTRNAKQISETPAAEADYSGLASYSEGRREVRASEARRTEVAPYPSIFTNRVHDSMFSRQMLTIPFTSERTFSGRQTPREISGKPGTACTGLSGRVPHQARRG
jgi:hypothetical protein